MGELNLIKLLFLVLVFTKLAGRNSGEYASLSLSESKNSKYPLVNESFCAIYNPSYASIPTRKQAEAGLYHPGALLRDYETGDPLACANVTDGLVDGLLVNHSVIVERGNCSFYRKALNVQHWNGSVLLLVYNESVGDLVPSLDPEEDGPQIGIPVLFVSNKTGEALKNWLSTSLVYLAVFIPSSSPVDPGSVVLFCIAVGTVLLSAFLANIPFQFLRYGLLFRRGVEYPSEGEGSTSRKMTVFSMLFGLVIMVSATCALLLLLYFFYSPMVYIVLALYCVASVVGLYSLLSPFVALIPLGDRCRVPPNKFPIIKYEPNILFFVTVLFCVCVVFWWAIERHSVYAWILQDILGFAFITMLLSRLRFLKVWFVAALMSLLFLYDIFMVFITPYFTSDGVSVMEKAATGPEGGTTHELLPVVFLVPKLLYPSTLEAICSEYIKSRPASLLGYGDVGIPGLLVTLCYKFDLHFRRGKWFKIYYATCGIAYIVGLAITYVALALMQTAQPALLYLVPTTLGSVTILSLVRKEFTLFFTNKLTGHDAAQVEYTPKRQHPPDSHASSGNTEATNAADLESAMGAESDTESEVIILQDEKQEERKALISDREDTVTVL